MSLIYFYRVSCATVAVQKYEMQNIYLLINTSSRAGLIII